MTMEANGLVKLMEECGELIQICAKKIAFPVGEHPDGVGNTDARLTCEVADVLASCFFVIETLDLDVVQLDERLMRKLDLYRQWHGEPV